MDKRVYSGLASGLLAAGLSTAAPAAAQPAAEGAWATLAAADVDAYCADIRGIHPGMVDPYAPGFAERVEQACSAATRQAGTVTSYYEWRDTMGELVGSFRDGHTNIRFLLTPERLQWPGFLIYGQGGGWVVRRPDHDDVAEAGDPPEGAVFLGCDGRSADAFLEDRLDPALADWSKEPERIRLAYRAFVAPQTQDPPAQTCRFEIDGAVTETELDWRRIDDHELQRFLPIYTRRWLRDEIDVEFAEDGHVWIQLPNVSDETRLEELATELEANRERLRAAPYVVFDLRGGAGGNSTWGERFASILWGEEAVDARRLATQSRTPGEFGKYWRASQAASEAAEAVALRFAGRGPDYQPVYDYFHGLSERMASEPAGLIEDECCQPEPVPTAMPEPQYDGLVFVLTDAAAFSSSVVVMNRLKYMGAVHVGETSGQNEVWGESAGPLTLPSGLGTYRVPMSIIRQPRRELGGLPPDIAWSGAMDDEAGIRAWIAELAARPALPGE